MIIGLVGPRFSGKTNGVGKILREEYAFLSLAFGDEVRLERDARGLPPDYDLHTLGVDLRSQFGSEYWGRRVAERILGEPEKRKYVVEGIRTRGDVDVFRRFLDFTLVGVTAPLNVRWERQNQRTRPPRPDDAKTYEEFVERCKRDESSGPGGLESGSTFRMAEYVIENDSSMDDLKKRVDEVVVFANRKNSIDA